MLLIIFMFVQFYKKLCCLVIVEKWEVVIFRILDFYRLSDLECPDFVVTTGLGCCIPPCFLVMFATGWERTFICWYGRGLGELWNTGMVGVFVAFIRVVYGRMIYMSLPVYNNQDAFASHYYNSVANFKRNNVHVHYHVFLWDISTLLTEYIKFLVPFGLLNWNVLSTVFWKPHI